MYLDFLEEALKVARDKNPQNLKIFIAKIEAIQKGYIRIMDMLEHQKRIFESNAKELDLVKDLAQFPPEGGPKL